MYGNVMKSGYNVVWTNKAAIDFDAIIKYLTENWTEKELTKLKNWKPELRLFRNDH